MILSVSGSSAPSTRMRVCMCAFACTIECVCVSVCVVRKPRGCGDGSSVCCVFAAMLNGALRSWGCESCPLLGTSPVSVVRANAVNEEDPERDRAILHTETH